MAFAPTRAQIQCPSCGTPITAQVYNIVDAAAQPDLKETLLAGALNAFQCPACGAVGALQAPLLYHDPNKELLLLYIPMGLNLPAQQEERLVAEMTNAVLNATPPQQRKGYLLKPPTRAISLQGLAEQILEADGISREAIRQQTELIKLIGTLAEYVGSDEKLKALVEENKDKIGYELLLLVSATIEAAAQQHDEESVERYTTLREKLIQFAGLSQDQIPDFDGEATFDELIDTLRHLPPERLHSAVAANRPLLDYSFFLHLSSKLDEATGEERAALESLRSRLVALTDEMDQQAKEAMERASAQLSGILQADDMDAAIEERIDELDEAFLVVLSANIQAAQEQKREDVVEVLTRIYHDIITRLQARLRPELQLINQLLQTTDLAERRALLQEALQTYNPAGFLELLQSIADDVEAQGAGENLVAALRQIEDEVQVAVEGTSSPARGRQSSGILTPDQTAQPTGEPPKIYIPGRDR
ncbi:MAG: CpXC domain-containing protein [Ardenticatenaceae bacterium]|nr:CpXC domain-containing protein [Ardenticatenaceae bacterium]HBY95065.1 hypothetical protein [Chloroflexota bacterium]